MVNARVHNLSNGCRVILRPTPGKDILAIVASVGWGSRDDAADRAGKTNLMARLFVKGARSRTALEIAEALESVGGGIEAFCSYDSMGIETQTVTEDWPTALEVLTECLFEPTFPADEFEKERAMVQAEILRAEDDKFSLTYKKFQELFYRGHLYGTMPEGEVETVGALERREVVELHEKAVRPDRMVLVVVGNVPEAEFLAEVEKRWSFSPESELAPRREAVRSPGGGAGETVVLTKDVEQGFVILGFPSPRSGRPENPALRVACGILGEGMSARLFSRLRDRDHLAYVVGASQVGRDLASHLIMYIGTSPATVEAARDGISREVEGLLAEPPEEPEIERARRYILGKHLIARQTNSALAHSMAAAETMGLGWDWSEGFPGRIKAVTGDAALAAARKYLTNPAIAILRPPEA